MALGSFTGKGFQFTIDINSKLNWSFFISRLALKENINLGWKRFGFKLIKKKVMGITYKEKASLGVSGSLGSGSSCKNRAPVT